MTPEEARAELARRELARRGVQPETDYKQVIGSAVKDAFMKPATFAKDLGTNPETMANQMPSILGFVGGVSPIPGGATAGTAIGQGIRAGALTALGKKDQIPAALEVNSNFPYIHGQIPELALSVIGDVGAIPAIKSRIAGKAIGEAEDLAGVGNLTKLPPPSQARTAVVMYQKVKDQLPNMTPMQARAIKPAFDWVASRGVLGNSEYAVDFFKVKKNIDALVNKIPGRAEPAADFGRAMKIPRTIGKVAKSIPKPVQKGIEYGIGGGVGWSAIKKLLGL